MVSGILGNVNSTLKQYSGQYIIPILVQQIQYFTQPIEDLISANENIGNAMETIIMNLNTSQAQYATLSEQQLLARGMNFRQNYSDLNKIKNLLKKTDTMLTDTKQMINTIVNTSPIPIPRQPAAPKQTQIADPNAMILNFIRNYRTQIGTVTMHLPSAIVGFILDKTFESPVLYDTRPTTLSDLIENHFAKKLVDSIDVSDETTKQKIVKEIKENVLPKYTNLFDLSVKGSLEMIENYFNYILNQYQFIKVYNLLLKNL
jgi:hypothetical protein